VTQFPGQFPELPPPYQPPRPGDGGYSPLPRDLLAPSRRASLLLLIIGIASVALALIVIVGGRYMPDEALRQSQANWPKSAGPPPSVEQMRMYSLYSGILFAVIGVIFAGLGIAVRGGRRIPAIIAIGAAGVAGIWLIGTAGPAMLSGGNSTGAMCGLVIFIPIIVLLAMVIRSLFQSLSTSRRLAGYYQHEALQQMYRQPPPPPPGPADTIPDYNSPPPPPPPSKAE
jgi:hypothetical protein